MELEMSSALLANERPNYKESKNNIIWEHEFNGRIGPEGDNECNFRVRDQQFSGQLFKIRNRRHEREQDRLLEVILLGEDLG